jgi:hypothetical protein
VTDDQADRRTPRGIEGRGEPVDLSQARQGLVGARAAAEHPNPSTVQKQAAAVERNRPEHRASGDPQLQQAAARLTGVDRQHCQRHRAGSEQPVKLGPGRIIHGGQLVEIEH